MTTATFTHSRDTTVKIGTTGSETDISDNVDNSYLFDRGKIHQFTGYGSSVEKNAPGNADWVLFMEGPWDPALHAILSPLNNVVGKSCVYSPAGSTAGDPKITITGFVKGYRTDGDKDKGGRRWSAFFFCSGTLAETAYP